MKCYSDSEVLDRLKDVSYVILAVIKLPVFLACCCFLHEAFCPISLPYGLLSERVDNRALSLPIAAASEVGDETEESALTLITNRIGTEL